MNRYAVVFEESAQAEDHAVEVQLTAASEGKVFRRVRELLTHPATVSSAIV